MTKTKNILLALGALAATETPIRIEGIGRDALQGDVRFADAAAAMGARITWLDHALEVPFTLRL